MFYINHLQEVQLLLCQLQWQLILVPHYYHNFLVYLFLKLLNLLTINKKLIFFILGLNYKVGSI